MQRACKNRDKVSVAEGTRGGSDRQDRPVLQATVKPLTLTQYRALSELWAEVLHVTRIGGTHLKSQHLESGSRRIESSKSSSAT